MIWRDHGAEVTARLEANAQAALSAMGEAAVGLIAARMRGGYGAPVVDTGRLLADVGYEVGEATVDVGNSLPYSVPVHEGTARAPGRPYIADALLGAADVLQGAASEALRQGFDG